MIISKISMGLGNQMFQYAAGRALSLHKNVPLALDLSSYEGYHLRRFELESIFTVQVAKATNEELKSYQLKQPLKSIWNKLLPFNRMFYYHLPYEMTFEKRTILQLSELVSPSYRKRTFIEPHYHYEPNFNKAPYDVHLIGYWMSWRYFEKYDNEIRQDFTFRRSLINHLSGVDNEMTNSNSVSIHIRRGDFASEKNKRLHGVIPISFYQKAIELIASEIPSIQLYIFSDDIRWSKENLNTKFPAVFVSGEITKTSYEDFYLMSRCKHNIIANSTFSWWAAYLNNNPHKMVIAPKKWYNKSSYNYKDVYPLSWITLSN